MATVTTVQKERTAVIEGDYGAWRDGQAELYIVNSRTAASGVWTADDTFMMTIRFYETPYCWTVTCRFEGDQLIADFDFNVAFSATHLTLHGTV